MVAADFVAGQWRGKQMRVLVTGGSGFIGAWIIRRLLAMRAAVRVLDVKPSHAAILDIVGPTATAIEWRRGDVSALADVNDAAADCDVALHLAAILTPACKADPTRGAEINLIGTLNVFEAARRHGMRSVIYMSSAGVFGPSDGLVPFPTTLYGALKLAGEGCARAFWEDHRIPSVGFRPLVVYGPGRELGLTAGPTLACRAAARGEAYVIPFSGATDFIYVDDVAAAFVAPVQRGLSGASVFNLLGVRASVDEFARAIAAAVPGARITVDGPPLPITDRIDPGSLRDAFPEIPRTDIAAGIAATIAHYRRSPQ